MRKIISDLLLSIPIKYKHTLRVQCKIFSPDKTTYREVSLIIDTGASATSLLRSELENLNYSNLTKGRTINRTAGGLLYLDKTILSRIEIGGEFGISNLEINVLDWEDSSVHGIIGMDILSRLHIHSDTKYFNISSEPFKILERERNYFDENFEDD